MLGPDRGRYVGRRHTASVRTGGRKRRPGVRALLAAATVAPAVAGTAVLMGLTPARGAAQAVYRRATIDRAGQLQLILADGRALAVPPNADQTGVAQAAVAPDRRSVGWVALYSDGTTDFPLALVVRTRQTTHTFTGDGRPIWRWAFSRDGTRVVWEQGSMHGDSSHHFECRDLRTGRRVGALDTAAWPPPRHPAWLRAFERAR